MLDAFTKGLEDAGHSYEIADLYETGFQSEMDEAQYLRETSGKPNLPVPTDVEDEQAKINRARGLVFIYPVWWSDCPAKLKGWFDRVLTCGYAYVYDAKGARGTRMSIEKALVLCSSGHTAEHLAETGIADSMRRVMLEDRLLGVGVKQAHMEILDDTHLERNLRRAYELGKGF
ncbi:MAG: NAD(P)H-dependent oxidoreductase [Planctomycetota bacterium]